MRRLLVVAAVVLVARTASALDVPPSVPDPDRLAPDARAEMASIWARRTVSRTAVGPPARVPIDLYRIFVDHPDVAAAAGRHLGVGRYRVTRVSADVFDVEDDEATHGRYHVVAKTDRQRVVLARFRRVTRLWGQIDAAAIGVLTMTPHLASDGGPEVAQTIESTVRIDHRVIAFVARVLVPLFPRYADRKVSEVLTVATRAAAWSRDDPSAFCRWLGGEPDGARQRQTFAPYVPECADVRR